MAIISRFKDQLAEILANLLDGSYEAVLKDELVEDREDGEDGEDLQNFNQELKQYAHALTRNRELVRELLPYIFDMVVSLSSFDVRLRNQSSIVQSFMKELMELSDKFKGQFDNISTSQQKNIDSIANASNLLKVGSDNATTLTRSMNAEKTIVEQVRSTLADLESNSNEMGRGVDTLISHTSTISETIGGIKTIADDITLVALNASVEAAKAGLAGKGFSVIAAEVRTLSEQTKSLLEKLHAILEKVSEASSSSKSGLALTLDGIEKIDSMTQKLLDSTIENNENTVQTKQNLEDAHDLMQNVLAETNGTSAIIRSSESNVDSIVDISNHLSTVSVDITDVTHSFKEMMEVSGNKMTQLSGKVMQTRQMGISNHEFVEVLTKAVEAHNEWIGFAKEMVSTMKVIPLQTDSTKSGFGFYYTALNPQSPSVRKIWLEIDELHQEIHEIASELVAAVKVSDSNAAYDILDNLLDCSEEILELFSEITYEAKQLGSNSVFKG